MFFAKHQEYSRSKKIQDLAVRLIEDYRENPDENSLIPEDVFRGFIMLASQVPEWAEREDISNIIDQAIIYAGGIDRAEYFSFLTAEPWSLNPRSALWLKASPLWRDIDREKVIRSKFENFKLSCKAQLKKIVSPK